MKEISIREAQKRMLNLLKTFDAICQKYSLNYWLDAGTLLGAVRHKGFIPWDDDIDIGMDRNSFEKFKKIITTIEKSDQYFFQSIETDPDCHMYSICKLRLNHTEIVENNPVWQRYNYHRGFPVDIFPFDLKNKNVFYNKGAQFLAFLLNIKGSYPLYKSNYSNNSGLKNKLKWILIKSINIFFTRKILLAIKNLFIKNYTRSDSSEEYIYGVELPFHKYNTIKKEVIFPLLKIEFEGVFLNAPNNTDIYLKNLYGNTYMQMPPIEQRETHYNKYLLLD